MMSGACPSCTQCSVSAPNPAFVKNSAQLFKETHRLRGQLCMVDNILDLYQETNHFKFFLLFAKRLSESPRTGFRTKKWNVWRKSGRGFPCRPFIYWLKDGLRVDCRQHHHHHHCVRHYQLHLLLFQILNRRKCLPGLRSQKEIKFWV